MIPILMNVYKHVVVGYLLFVNISINAELHSHHKVKFNNEFWLEFCIIIAEHTSKLNKQQDRCGFL